MLPPAAFHDRLARYLHAGVGVLALVATSALGHLPIDVAVWRPSQTKLFVDYDRDGNPDLRLRFGMSGDRVMVADMDGDGLPDLVIYRSGIFYVDRTFTGVFTQQYVLGGLAQDIGLVGDVDGDGAVDIVVFRDGMWYASTQRNGIANKIYTFGAPGDKPLLCDVDFDGVADLVVFRNGTWYVDTNRDGIADAVVSFGQAGDEPFCADFDGDGHDDFGVYRNGVWYVLLDPIANPHPMTPIALGAPGDKPIAGRLDRRFNAAKFSSAHFRYGTYEPGANQFHFRLGDEDEPELNLAPDAPAGAAVAGDFNGDGRTDIALWSGGFWYIDFDLDGRTDLVVGFGAPGDIPLAGDIDGSGHADFVLYRNGLWYVDTEGNGVPNYTFAFGGMPGDVPLLGDLNGDGRADLVIYRGGTWFVSTQRNGVADMIFNFGGLPGDIPLLVDWTGDGRADPVIYRAGTWYLSRTPSSGQTEAMITLGDATMVPVAGAFAIDSVGAPMLFAAKARPIPGAGRYITSPAYDTDNDGWVDMIGGHNASGTIQAQDWTALGLSTLFSGGRLSRDTRFADLDNDGIPDIVSNTYAPITDAASFARLYKGNANGTYTEDPAFAAMNIRGFGETIVVADFHNHGILDIFIPYYSHNSPNEHSYLLTRASVSQPFTDIADAAGVALRNVPSSARPEAAQAVDYDGDGWIDLYVAGHLFRNNGIGPGGYVTFTDVTAAVGLAPGFDEGAKFVDWNNDGKLDLIVHHPMTGPVLWEFDGAQFHRRDVFPRYAYDDQNGVHVVDLDGDGREDVVVGSGSPQGRSIVFRNTGTRFARVPFSLLEGLRFGTLSSAEFDHDGRRDLTLQRASGSMAIAKGLGPAPPAQTITIEVVDSLGHRNQQGRVVRVSPNDGSGRTFTRVVDGGSGYLSQTAYPVVVTTDFVGSHQVSVRFAANTVSFAASPGQRFRVYANGTVQPY